LHNEIQRGVREYVKQNELRQFNNLGAYILDGPLELDERKPKILRQYIVDAQNQHLLTLRLYGDTALADYLEEKGDPNMIDTWVFRRLLKHY